MYLFKLISLFIVENVVMCHFSGMHHNSVDCDSSQAILKFQYVIENATNMRKLFPKKLKVSKVLNKNDASDNLKPWGGWSDIRDQVLCLNMTTLY
jgi:N-acetylglucosaminyltransferase II (MGAT2)